MCQKYRNGATIYELGREFGIDRHTVAVRLKKAGVRMRLQSPTPKEIDEMVKLHEFEDSVANIASRIGYSTNTVYNQLRARGYAKDTERVGEN